MDPQDRVTVVVTLLIEAAMAGGMTEVKAKKIYYDLMDRLATLEEKKAGFYDAFSVALREALDSKVRRKN
jgi:hypothetical protein